MQTDAGETDNKYEARDARVKQARTMLAELHGKKQPAGGAPGVSDPLSLPDPKDKIEEQNLLHAAMVASEDDRSADARELLEKTLALDPKSPVALRQLGELELQAGDYAHAAQHLKGAVEIRPGDAAAWFCEGKALEKMHDLAGARNALEASLHLCRSSCRLVFSSVTYTWA